MECCTAEPTGLAEGGPLGSSPRDSALVCVCLVTSETDPDQLKQEGAIYLKPSEGPRSPGTGARLTVYVCMKLSL